MANKNGYRATAEEKENMILTSAEYLLDNQVSRKHFTEWFLSTFTRVESERMAHYYWKWGWEKVTALREDKVKDRRAKRITQLEQTLWEIDDPKERAKVIMSISKLEGIDIHRVELENNVRVDKPIFKIDLGNE